MQPNNNNISQEDFESIERYLNNEMTNIEHENFKKLLEENPEFQQQVNDFKLIFKGIETQTLKEKMDEFHKDLKVIGLNTNKNSISIKKYAVAASVIVLLGFSSFWLFNQNTNEKLYAKYFNPDPGLATTMSENSNFEFYDAMVNYKQKDYKTAINKWETLLDSKPKNDTLNYFLGVAYLANKNKEKAITYLNNVTQTSSSNFKNEAYYYLGLAHLKSDNLELAKKNLTLSTVDNSKNLLSELID